MQDLISRSALLEAMPKNDEIFSFEVRRVICNAPAVDAEVVRHEGNTTLVTTDNLDAYADRIIVVQGNWCNVYYRDSDDAEVQDVPQD